MLSLACLALISRSGLAGLVEADANFAAEARSLGPRQAILRVLAPDAMLFRTGRVSGSESLATGSAMPGIRAQKPAVAGLARSEDWGFTAGSHSTAGVPHAFGNYVSVWRKDGQRWLLIVDFATPRTPALEGFTELGSRFAYPLRADRSMALTGLLETDRALGKVGWKSYRAFLDPNGIIMRSGSKATRGTSVREESWSSDKALIAPSADLGCTYGTLTFGSAGRGDYIRIWARNELGSWRILVDAATRRPTSN